MATGYKIEELESDAALYSAIAEPGLTVVDVHKEWCGPCKALFPTYQRLLFDNEGKKLSLFGANSDQLEALEQYRSSCRPTLLFFRHARLLTTLEGANASELTVRVRELVPEPADEEKIPTAGVKWLNPNRTEEEEQEEVEVVATHGDAEDEYAEDFEDEEHGDDVQDQRPPRRERRPSLPTIVEAEGEAEEVRTEKEEGAQE